MQCALISSLLPLLILVWCCRSVFNVWRHLNLMHIYIFMHIYITLHYISLYSDTDVTRLLTLSQCVGNCHKL